mmetsp:Transcript_86181/g.216888  ORF Transcript_86181/g.216888 Transcript_86181/m.216888 type:complete len:233 (-) Transcript_86181:2014-2712(-)
MSRKTLYQLPPAWCHFAAALFISSTTLPAATSSLGQDPSSRRYKHRLHSALVTSPDLSTSTTAHSASKSSLVTPGTNSSSPAPLDSRSRSNDSNSKKVKRPLPSPSASLKSLPQSFCTAVLPWMPRLAMYAINALSRDFPTFCNSSSDRSGTKPSSSRSILLFLPASRFTILCMESALPCCRIKAVNSRVVTWPEQSASRARHNPRTSASDISCLLNERHGKGFRRNRPSSS